MNPCTPNSGMVFDGTQTPHGVTKIVPGKKSPKVGKDPATFQYDVTLLK